MNQDHFQHYHHHHHQQQAQQQAQQQQQKAPTRWSEDKAYIPGVPTFIPYGISCEALEGLLRMYNDNNHITLSVLS